MNKPTKGNYCPICFVELTVESTHDWNLHELYHQLTKVKG